jgi:hypothetical protein
MNNQPTAGDVAIGVFDRVFFDKHAITLRSAATQDGTHLSASTPL